MKNILKKVKKIHFRPDFYYETAQDFCFHLGIDAQDIANLTGSHPSTATKWLKNDRCPCWLLPFLYAACGGIISDKAFYGWNLNNGIVNAPGIRYGLTAAQIESYCWHMDTLKQSQALIAKLNNQQQKPSAIIIPFPNSRR